MGVGVYPKGRNILVTGGRGCFGHKLRNELKKMGAMVVLFDIYFLQQNNSDGKTSKNRQKSPETTTDTKDVQDVSKFY